MGVLLGEGELFNLWHTCQTGWPRTALGKSITYGPSSSLLWDQKWLLSSARKERQMSKDAVHKNQRGSEFGSRSQHMVWRTTAFTSRCLPPASSVSAVFICCCTITQIYYCGLFLHLCIWIQYLMGSKEQFCRDGMRFRRPGFYSHLYQKPAAWPWVSNFISLFLHV